MAKKTTPKKKAPVVKAKSKTATKPAAKKTTIKKMIKPVSKKVAPKIVAKKPLKPVIKKKVVKKPLSKKPVSKPQIKKVVKKVVKPVVKKVVAKVKPIAKKKLVPPVKKKVVTVKKAVPAKKVMPAKKVVVAKAKPVVKVAVVKPQEKPIKKPAPAEVKPKVEKKARPVPIKLPVSAESNYSRADMFYKNVLHAEIIKRYSPKKEEDKDMLSKDISLHVKMNDKETTISEKTRDQDWNDIYVEIYKKYPDEAGWIKFTEAEYLAYFFPGRVFLCKLDPIRNLCQDILCRAVNTGIFKDMYYMFFRSSGRHSQSIKINNKTYNFTFHQTYHENGENSYYSIGLILPFVMLMDFRIDYKIFKQ